MNLICFDIRMRRNDFIYKGVESLQINMTGIVKKYQEYIFLAKNTVKEKKQEVFRELHTFVKKELRDFVKYVKCLPRDFIDSLPGNYLDIAKLISKDAWRYLLDVGPFVMTGLYQEEQDTFLKAKGCCLCREREAWKREGVWESLSVSGFNLHQLMNNLRWETKRFDRLRSRPKITWIFWIN